MSTHLARSCGLRAHDRAAGRPTRRAGTGRAISPPNPSHRARLGRPERMDITDGMIVVDTPAGPMTCTPTAYLARYADRPVIAVVPARSDRRFRPR